MTLARRHGAMPFIGPQGFVKAACEVFLDALDRGAVPVLLHDAPHAAAVRAELGERGAGLRVFDTGSHGRNPARVLPALQRFVDEHPGHELCFVAEPIRAGMSRPQLAEHRLHELLLHLPAFRDWNCSLTCGYDVDALADEVAEDVARRHREAPADADDQVARVRAEALPPRPVDSHELGVDRTTLGALRGFIEERATRAGLDDERVDDLVYAVNEVVTNSLCHGEGRARVSFWHADEAIVCEVRDRGWIRDPLAGRVAPQPDRPNGRGLWLVNQLCDLVQLRSSPAGTTLRLYIETGTG